MRRALAILLLVLVAGVARAETVRFPSVAVGTVAAGPELSGWLYRPKGEGPFPATCMDCNTPFDASRRSQVRCRECQRKWRNGRKR